MEVFKRRIAKFTKKICLKKYKKYNLTFCINNLNLTGNREVLFFPECNYKKTGDDILAKILEVTPSEIKYKNFDNTDSPTFTGLKSDL